LEFFFDADGKAVSHGMALRVLGFPAGPLERVSYPAVSKNDTDAYCLGCTRRHRAIRAEEYAI